MISHSKKFIYVHVPRTGGTILERGMRRYGKVLQGERNFGSVYFKHAAATDIKRMMGDPYDDYFKFSIVRNPWDWVVSNYAFNRGLHRCYVVGTRYQVASRVPEWAKNMSFEQWLRWWLDELNPSQLGMLTNDAGTLLVDEVYRFENIRQDVVRICGRLDVALEHNPVDNRGRRKSADYRDYYSGETRRWVADHFRKEIELFNYAFEPAGAATS